MLLYAVVYCALSCCVQARSQLMQDADLALQQAKARDAVILDQECSLNKLKEQANGNCGNPKSLATGFVL